MREIWPAFFLGGGGGGGGGGGLPAKPTTLIRTGFWAGSLMSEWIKISHPLTHRRACPKVGPKYGRFHTCNAPTSANAKVLARIKKYRRVAIWMAKWRYGGRGAPGERSESQSKHRGAGAAPPCDFF